MNTKNIADLLENSCSKLNLATEVLYEGTSYNIVDFCLDYVKMSNEDTIKFCQENFSEFPVFTVRESINELEEADQSLMSRIGNKLIGQSGMNAVKNVDSGIQKTAQAAGTAAQRINPVGYSSRPAPTNKPGMFNLKQRGENFFGTHQSVVRNSPLVKIVTPNGTATFLSFPQLDQNNPSHIKILQDIMALETKEGKTVSMVSDVDRDAALKNRNKVTIQTALPNDMDKKEQVKAALDKLSKLIDDTKGQVSHGLAFSGADFDKVKAEASKILDLGKSQASAPEDPAATAKVATDAAQQIDNKVKDTPTDPQSTPGKPAVQPAANNTFLAGYSNALHGTQPATIAPAPGTNPAAPAAANTATTPPVANAGTQPATTVHQTNVGGVDPNNPFIGKASGALNAAQTGINARNQLAGAYDDAGVSHEEASRLAGLPANRGIVPSTGISPQPTQDNPTLNGEIIDPETVNTPAHTTQPSQDVIDGQTIDQSVPIKPNEKPFDGPLHIDRGPKEVDFVQDLNIDPNGKAVQPTNSRPTFTYGAPNTATSPNPANFHGQVPYGTNRVAKK